MSKCLNSDNVLQKLPELALHADLFVLISFIEVMSALSFKLQLQGQNVLKIISLVAV